nr:RNA-directed DNA polymerase, eukaryota [Tanacetum cinerariifolium]
MLQDGFLTSWKKMMMKNIMMMMVLMYMNRVVMVAIVMWRGSWKIIFEESGQKEKNLDEEHTDKQENHSGDPFSIYKLLKKKKDNVEKENNSEHSMKYPPGFTPKEGNDVVGMHAEESRSDNIVNLSDHNAEEVNNTFSGNCPKKNSNEDISNSVCSGHFKTSMVPRTGGSILSLMDELVKVGQVMGYKMDGCMSNMIEIIESQRVKEVNCLALQETKMENMELFSVKMCWGNFVFDYVHSDSVGEVVVMGDFNEVRYKSDRFGSVFNVQGAYVFNSFITNAGLEEVPLGGSSFTWCHKSATKMSKLDRFLIENLLNTCPNITAITLEQYLSDHRPILLRESRFDYGPTSFRFFHHWIEMEGFNKVVEDAWREGPCDESNAMINMMINLKYLKTEIREWNKKNMLSAKNVEAKYKDELEALEVIIDKGDGNVEVVNKRIEVVNTLQKIDKICSSEMAQKAKVELESSVSNEEIKRAVWDCGIDKSPSPDRFTFDANTVKDFRPISLIGSLYKIIAKILANHLVGVLEDIVNEVQSAFIVGRQSLDVHVLECFYRASGLRINMNKSKIMGVLVDSDKVKCDASKLGCLILKTPFSYLGSKVGGSMSRVHTWNEVVDRVKNRLSKWKMKTLSIGGINLLDFMHVKLGNGDKTAFWEDILIEGKALKNGYPRIYSLETCKLIIVGMKLAQTSLDSSFRRVPRGGVEQEQFDKLSALVHDVTLTPVSDRWIWALESLGDFSVVSVRKVIDDKSLPKVDSKTRWIKYVPIKVNMHAWKVKTDSLPTRFNVSRRGIHIDSIMCPICDKGAKTSSHLFFSCCMARQTVRMITRWWDVPYGEVDSYLLVCELAPFI